MGAHDNMDTECSSKKKRKIHIEDVILAKPETAEPVFVTFTNGSLMGNANLCGTLHYNTSKAKRLRRQKVLTVETPRMTYAARNTGTDGAPAKESVFLGVLDKNTGKMKLIETNSFNLHPTIQEIKSTNAQLQDSVHSLTYDEKQEHVASSFGSKKLKQVVNRRKQYKVNTEEMSSAVDQAASELQGAALPLEDNKEDKDIFLSILPKCDRKAARVEDVYKLADIAPDDMLCLFEAPATELIKGEKEPAAEEYTLLFRALLGVAKMEEEELSRLRLVSLAMYVETLIKFIKTPSRRLDFKTLTKNGCPNKIANYLLDEYTQKSGNTRIRDRKNEDRVHCCILVLAFIGNKYELCIPTLLQSMPVKRDKLDVLMRVVGATYARESSTFKLQLPLTKMAKAYSGYKK